MGDLVSWRCDSFSRVYTFMVAPNRKITVKGADRAMQDVELRLLRQAWEMGVAVDNVCEGSACLMRKLGERFQELVEDPEQKLAETMVSWSLNVDLDLVECVFADGSDDQYCIGNLLGLKAVEFLERFLEVVPDNFDSSEPTFSRLEKALKNRIQQLNSDQMVASPEQDEAVDDEVSDYEDGFYLSEEVSDGDE